MWLMHVSLLHGWLPPSVTALAFGLLIVGVAWWRRAAWHWAVVAIVALGLTWGINHWIDLPSKVGSDYPRSFVVWAALPLFALGAALWQWPRVVWWRRGVAFVAVPLLAAFAGLQIDAHYGYLPTVGDLVGAPLPGQVNAAVIDRGPGARRFYRGRPVAAFEFRTGDIAGFVIPGPVSHFHGRPGFVWVPPWYFTHPTARLPVLMLLSGTPGTTADWLRTGGALSVAATYAQQHNGYAPIMVFPDANGSDFGDTECVNGPRGRAETYLTVDVPNFMHTHFNAPLDPQRWAVAGMSEGGTCALELATRNPDRFGTFADFSGDGSPTIGTLQRTIRNLYGGSYNAMLAHDPLHWFRLDTSEGLAGDLAVGSHDNYYLRVNHRLALLAHRDKLPIVLDIIHGGGHNFPTWFRSLSDAFPWIVQRLHQPTTRA
jgi:S-formylglutathione hydrolase FrmB